MNFASRFASCALLSALLAQPGLSQQSGTSVFDALYLPSMTTVALSSGQRVQLLGVKPIRSVAARSSLAAIRAFMKSKRVWIETDRGARDAGSVGVIVHLIDTDDTLNEELLRRGYVAVDERYPFAKLQEYRALEQQARVERAGLWSQVKMAPPRTNEATSDGETPSFNGPGDFSTGDKKAGSGRQGSGAASADSSAPAPATDKRAEKATERINKMKGIKPQ